MTIKIRFCYILDLFCLFACVLVAVEGFNVFKASASEIVPKENDVTVVDSEAKKEYHRQMEVQSTSL